MTSLVSSGSPAEGSPTTQPAAAPTITGAAPEGQDVQTLVEMVQTVIVRAMAGDREVVARHVAPDAELTFVGRRLAGADDIGRFNAGRYKWVKKSIAAWDVSFSGNRTIVTSVGTLYGEWPDGTPFEGNRYIDRFVLVDGKIVQMDVWNDSAEILLTRAGAATKARS